MNQSIKIILSDTSKSLWENDIPVSLMNDVVRYFPRIPIKDLQRHDPILVNIFEHYYQINLINCSFASIYFMPKSLQQYYKIVQLNCYQHKLPEILEIDKPRWIQHCKLINERTEHLIHTSIFKKLYWREKWLTCCSLVNN